MENLLLVPDDDGDGDGGDGSSMDVDALPIEPIGSGWEAGCGVGPWVLLLLDDLIRKLRTRLLPTGESILESVD